MIPVSACIFVDLSNTPIFRVNDHSALGTPTHDLPGFPSLGAREQTHRNDAPMASSSKKSKEEAHDDATKKRVEDARETVRRESAMAGKRIGAGAATEKAKKNLSEASAVRGAAWNPPQNLHLPDR